MPRTSLLTMILLADGSSAKAQQALSAMEASIGAPSATGDVRRDGAAEASSLASLDQMFGYFDPLAPLAGDRRMVLTKPFPSGAGALA